MAVFKNDPFPGTDYNQYLSWKKITTPQGQIFYVVPGNEAYVYDPVASNATGRKVFRANPSAAMSEAEAQKKEQQDLIDQQKFNSSPIGQLLPVAATTGGIIAASQFAPSAASPIEQAIAAQISGGATPTAAAAAQGAVTAAGAAPVSGIGPIANGGQYASNITPGMGAMPYFGLAGAGLGAYGLHNAIQADDPSSAGLSGAGLGLGLGMAAPLLGLASGPVGWGTLGLAALGGGLGGLGLQQAFGHKSTKEREADRWGATGVSPEVAASMVGHDYFTGTGGEQSRDEKFLTADSIRVNPDNYNNAPDWDKWTREQQDKFLNTLLQEGKVSERKGGIYYDDDRAKQIAAEIRNPTTPAQAAAQGATQMPVKINKPLLVRS